MAYLGGDQVLLFSGDVIDDSTWVYDLSANTWTEQTPSVAPTSHSGQGMVALGTDQVLLFGGKKSATYYTETWLAIGFSTSNQIYLPVVIR
jgi:N-acetylneuraminic acid mutarotase